MCPECKKQPSPPNAPLDLPEIQASDHYPSCEHKNRNIQQCAVNILCTHFMSMSGCQMCHYNAMLMLNCNQISTLVTLKENHGGWEAGVTASPF